MPQKVIKFAGINRKANEFTNSDNCEELINLRPKIDGGYEIVKNKDSIFNSILFAKVYVHSFGNVSNKIGVANDGRLMVIGDGSATAFSTTDFTSSDVVLSFAGNTILAYSEKDNKQVAFKYDADDYYKYKRYEFKPKKITNAHVQLNTEARRSVVADADTLTSINEALAMAASGFYSENPNGLCGTVIIGCTYVLDDGSEIWSTAFVVADFWGEPTYSATTGEVTVIGRQSAKLHLTFEDAEYVNIKRINIFSTRPVYRYEFKTSIQNETTVFVPYILSAEDSKIDSQLMYYQGYVIPDKTEITFDLDFSQSLAGEMVMEVTSGCIERIGKSVSYNNRFHFYDSKKYHIIQRPTISDPSGSRETSEYWVAYVLFNNEWKLIEPAYKFSSSASQSIIYPMAGVKKLAFVKLQEKTVETTSTETYDRVPNGTIYYGMTKDSEMFYVSMQDSSAYNYSYAFDVVPTLESASDFYDTVKAAGQLYGTDAPATRIEWADEENVMNVSAQYNPFIFPVNYSYNFDGGIKEIATSYLPISSTQIGQFPLTVFTKNGIYSLEQGSGSVLYGNNVPINSMVIDGKAESTPYGIFFASSGRLYILTGRECADVSYVMQGEREVNVRETDAYKRLCLDNNGYFYDFSLFLSNTDFDEIMHGAEFAYDQRNNELLISNESLRYSYVFNLDTRAFHKINARFTTSQNAARFAVKYSHFKDGTFNRVVVDLASESKGNQTILLQSRPMSFEPLYTHIQRLILLADAKLTDNQYLCLSVFGSDNLSDWKCIISAQKHNTVLRQIRTNKAAKSYKDYIILITGKVSTDTDISDILADYTVVNRRLG